MNESLTALFQCVIAYALHFREVFLNRRCMSSGAKQGDFPGPPVTPNDNGWRCHTGGQGGRRKPAEDGSSGRQEPLDLLSRSRDPNVEGLPSGGVALLLRMLCRYHCEDRSLLLDCMALLPRPLLAIDLSGMGYL